MKIISLYGNERLLIKKAKKGDRLSQKAIYESYAPKMLGVCRQYIRDIHYAEDVMVGGFVKVFKYLKDFEHRGSFEGWIRRIMVRESISYLRQRQFVVYDDEVLSTKASIKDDLGDLENVEHIQALIDQLPQGYKMVFVLYAVEGYKHHEIAALLNISEGTSKSQLSKARKQLQENLKLKDIALDTASK